MVMAKVIGFLLIIFGLGLVVGIGIGAAIQRYAIRKVFNMEDGK